MFVKGRGFQWLRALAGVALLTLLLLLADPGRFLVTLRSGDLVLAAVLFAAVLLLEALRIAHVFQGYGLDYRTAVRVTLRSMFFGSFTPGTLGGEIYKVYYVQRRAPGLARPVALTVLLRLAGVGATLSFAALYFAVYPGRLFDAPGRDLLQARWTGPWPGTLGAAALLLAAASGLALASPWGRALGRRTWTSLMDAGRALRQIRPPQMVDLALVSLLIAAARIVYLYLLARSFAPDLFLPDLAPVAAAAALASVIPITLGGLGMQEGALAAGLALIGLPVPEAVAASLLNRGFLWAAAAAGWLSLVRSRPGRGEPALRVAAGGRVHYAARRFPMDARALHDIEADLADPSPAGVASQTAAEPSRVRRLRDPGLATLALLPLVLLALDSDWIYSGPHRDAWIYYGYFQNAVFYLRHFQDHYYSSRLGVILPGFLLHHLLPPLAANVVLHLALYWSSVLSFYLVAKELFGTRVALLAGLALGCHPYFLQAAGWNYVDGFGITYFLIALLLLTRAAGSTSWRPLLLAAGAIATAILSTNIFYAVYLPLLAGHFVVLNRQRGRIPLLAGALWASLGAVGLFVLLGTLIWAMGGSFFYLRPSFQFLAGTIGTQNPFRDPTYAWLPEAVWLVFPAVALLGSVILLWRARTDASLRQDRTILWCQVQLVLLVLVTLYFQVAGDTGVLQHFFYASLLIPVAFVAFAGQLTQLTAGLPRKRFLILAAIVAVLQIVPLILPLAHSLSKKGAPFSAPVLLALFAGLGVAVAVWQKATGMRTILSLFLCLALSQLLVRQGGPIFEQFERHGGDGRGLFRQLSHAVIAIESFDPSQNARLWYDVDVEDGIVYDAVASAFLLCPRMIGLDFPDVSGGRMCDGVQLGPGVSIAILSADPSAFEKADAALRGIGLSAALLKREEIPGPSRGLTITYIRSEAGAAP